MHLESSSTCRSTLQARAMPSARAGRGGARVPSAELCAGSGHTSRHARAERRRANRRRSGRSRPWRPPGPCAALRLPGSAWLRGRRGAENPVFARWGHSSEKLNATTEKGGQSPYWMGVTVSSAHRCAAAKSGRVCAHTDAAAPASRPARAPATAASRASLTVAGPARAVAQCLRT